MMIPDFDVLLLLALASGLAGIVRGFTGFGAALLFTPLASTVVEPWRAVIMLFVIDGVMSLPLVPGAARQCNWREVVPLSIGAALTVPIGGYFLVSVDPTALRWALSGLAMAAVAVLATGWRYPFFPGSKLSAATGAASGLLGGMAGFYGPPLVIFWLGGQSATRTVRANTIVFFALMTVAAGLTYGVYGVLKLAAVGQALVLFPVYGAAIWLGARLFSHASDQLFRWIAYLLILGVAVPSTPGFETLGE
jgi:uncharacterized membrane protein YfcA